MRGFSNVVAAVQAELDRARVKHPDWEADDVVYCAAIVGEEAGELLKAAVQFRGEGGTMEACDMEVIQTAATCFRFLMRG